MLVNLQIRVSLEVEVRQQQHNKHQRDVLRLRPSSQRPPLAEGGMSASFVRLSCTDGEDRVNDLISACFRRNRKRAFPFLSTSSGSESSSSSVTLSLHPRSRRRSQISAVTSLRLWFRVLNIISVLV